MEKLYYQIPYVKTFEAEVISCTEGKNGLYEAVLDRTGFYPEGGGQPSDTGTLDGISVAEVHERDGEIIHCLTAPLEPKRKVAGVIDWEKRYDNMQLHSGEHLVSGLIHRHFGYDNVGFHMGSEEVTIDLNGILTGGQLSEIEREANQMIYDNIPVNVIYPTKEELHSLEYRSKKELTGQVRIVEIPGGDMCACCGTHVMRTGEIGLIKFLSMINYKGGVRISMLCGRRAMEDYQRKQDQITRISNLLSVKPLLAADAVEKIKDENGKKDFKINQLYQALFRMESDMIKSQDAPMLLMKQDMTPVQLRQFCTMLAEKDKAPWILVCSGSEESGYHYALGSGSQDMRPLGKELNASLNGRGGGSAPMTQGTFFAGKAEIEKAVAERAGEQIG